MTLFLSWNTQGDIYCRLYNKHAMKVNSDHGTTFLVNNFNFGLFLEQSYQFDNSYCLFFVYFYCAFLPFGVLVTIHFKFIEQKREHSSKLYFYGTFYGFFFFAFFLPFLEFWLPFTLNHMDNSYGLFFYGALFVIFGVLVTIHFQ